MDVFTLRDQVIDDYRRYVTSFMALRDSRVRERVEAALTEGRLWPEPRIGLNPAFASGGSVDELVAEGLLHAMCAEIFRTGKQVGSADRGVPLRFHRHQVDAFRAAGRGNYVLTTGTGSGKSLGYIVPIVDHVLRAGSDGSVKAIVVYPMNALANSQYNELEKFIVAGFTPGAAPVRFARYTGQERAEEREALLAAPPDILLTNFVMLELVLTRVRDRRLVRAARDLRFLVLDELHTYRGRQGADVALLVRRLREACDAPRLTCVGTSATLATRGTFAEQQQAIAEVAGTLFGSPVECDAVIGETLVRATAELENGPALGHTLRERVSSAPLPTDAAAFINDPLSSWVESTFGIREIDGRLVRMPPRPIDGNEGASRELALLTGAAEDACAHAIRRQLLGGSGLLRPGTPFPVFAFRLHQFISRGDTVFASLEPEASRHLTLQGQRFVPGQRDKVLLPLSFCRQCGQEYYTVLRERGDAGSRFVPRDLGDQGDGAGWLFLSTDAPWPADPLEELHRIPEDWLDPGGLRVKPENRKLLPVPLRVTRDGRVTDEAGAGQQAWWVPAPFRLCLRCGASYAARMRRDMTKLTTLGSEGRSTATTVLSMAIVRMLRGYPPEDLPDEARKLLSFTDNRQDAALQAGHFNDFVRVALLRAALRHALVQAGGGGLSYDELPRAVFNAVDLPLEEYARDPEVEFGAKEDVKRTLRDVLTYQLYVDLPPGWRVTQPNLEQCGLLEMEYVSLGELSGADDVWHGAHPALAGATPAVRERVGRVLLDHLRRLLAIRVDALDTDSQEDLQRRTGQRLNEAWDLGGELLTFASVVVPRSQQPGDYRGWEYLSARSGFGQFLRRPTTFPDLDHPLSVDETADVIRQLFAGLKRAGLVEEALTAPDGTPGYQIPAAAMRWHAGDGTRPYRDEIRMPTAADAPPAANEFFTALYEAMARDLIGLRAGEHTAQVDPEIRLLREGSFRRGELPILYCSPTMELGVDIADLNVVNLRNVPPTPANYAQRSGRAGRSGQPALVVAYCSVGSPHDQWYFHRPQLMVSGQVTPPRVDLANEDLLRAHIYAVWLAAAGLDLKSSLVDVLDVDAPGLPLQPSVAAHLADHASRLRAAETARRVVADLQPALSRAAWWSDAWVDDVLAAVPRAFEQAADRWRGLYRSAMRQFDTQNEIIARPLTAGPARQTARHLRLEAERQLELLTAAGDNRNQSDFYSYRYFAAEGFLPGYSFPRLPLSAFIPGGKRGKSGQEGEFVSRPRFLAISEFGPRSFVYHEGNRYEITKVILPPSERVDPSGEPVLTSVAKRCEVCAYLHPAEGNVAADVCHRCAAPLPASVPGLFRLQNVATRRRDRISSNEEERRRQGFELLTAFRFAERNGVLSIREGTVATAESPTYARLTYGDTATLWRFNLGRRRRSNPQPGFVLDIDKGTWASDADEGGTGDDDPLGPRTKRVVPFVEDSRNCLLVEFAASLPRDQLISVQMALHHAILAAFQLEEAELLSEPLPSPIAPRLILFYEATEGGAGVLRRLVEEEGALADVAATALTIAHFDGDGNDLGGPAGGERCEAACYDCLLSYYNQPVHEHLDRQLALQVLRDLATAVVHAGAGGATPDEQVAILAAQAGSGLEEEWLAYVREHGYRLPEEAQVLLDGVPARPDFGYPSRDAVVYIDGSWHDFPDRQVRDKEHREQIRGLGLRVIEFGHRDDWAQVFDTYRDVFGEGNL
jgi:hypothetical protein